MKRKPTQRILSGLLSVLMLCSLLTGGVAARSAAPAAENGTEETQTAPAATAPIEARERSAQASKTAGSVGNTENAVDFTSFGGSFAAGDYLAYPDVDFGDGSYEKLMLVLSASSESAGKKIEFRLDSPDGQKLGELTLRDTNGAQTFLEHYAEISSVSGVHTLYLAFPEAVQADLDFFILTSYHFDLYEGTDRNDKEAYDYLLTQQWESEAERDERMEWFRDAGFGMFIHYGPYAALGGRTLDGPYDAPYTPKYRQTSQAEWIMKQPVKIPKEIYQEYAAAALNPVNFDAKEIVKLAQDAGQKYIVFTTRHHDGFSMYDTHVRNFRNYSITTVAGNGGFQRDIVKELSDACKATYGTDKEVRFCAYLTLPDWYDETQYGLYGNGVGGGMDGSAVGNFVGETTEEKNKNRDDYLSRLKGQLRELLVDYDADMIWFDNANMIKLTHEQSYSIYNYIRALKPEALVNNRVFTYRTGTAQTTAVMRLDFLTAEQRALTDKPKDDFESCMTLNGCWGYHNTDQNWKSPQTVVDLLIQCVGLGGNLLLNIGPDGNGNVPEKSQEILREVGKWLAPVSDSVYGTRSAFYEVSDLPSGVFATAKEGKLFFHVMSRYTGGTLLVEAPANVLGDAVILNTGEALDYIQVNGKLFFDLSEVTRSAYDTVIALEVEGYPEAEKEEKPVNIAKTMFDAGKMTVTGSPAYISSSGGDFKLENIFSGTTGDNIRGDYYGAASSVKNGMEAILTFTEPVTVNKAVLYVRQAANKNQKIYDIEVQWWNPTQNDWETIGKDESATPRPDRQRAEIDFPAVTTDKIRLWLPKASEPSIREFELYYDTAQGQTAFAITAPENKIEAGNFVISGTCPEEATAVEVKLSGDGIRTTVLQAVPENRAWSVDVQTADWPACVEQLRILALMKTGTETAEMDYKEVVYGQWDNLAKDKTVITSSDYREDYSGAKLTNGNYNDRWASLAADEAPWFVVDLGETKSINRVVMYEWKDGSNYRAQKYRVECSAEAEGDSWTTVYEGMEIGAKGIAAFAPVEARRVRVSLLEYPVATKQPSIHEVEIFGNMPVYKGELEAELRQAAEIYGRLGEDLAAQGYTAETADRYIAALNAAEAVKKDENADQAAVNEAIAQLRAAIAGLVKVSDVQKPGAPALTAVEAGDGALTAVFTAPESTGGASIRQYVVTAVGDGQTYTATGAESPITVTGLTNGVTYAVTVQAENLAGAGEASNQMEATPEAVVSKTALEALYQANKDKENDNYTEESWSRFQNALAEAEKVLNDPSATQQEVDESTQALEQAINGLTQKPTEANTYTITVRQNRGGVITPDTCTVSEGASVTFTVTVEPGWELETLLVDGRTVDRAPIYTFRNVQEDHTIEAQYRFVLGDLILAGGTGGEVPGKPADFTDVKASDWFYADVQYVSENGLMAGVNEMTFAPYTALTRGMLVTILYRMEGQPATRYHGMFSDVPDYQWYTDAVEWAAKEGIVTGYNSGAFGPMDPVTREQLAAILYRYAGSQGNRASLGGYADHSSISGYAQPAMEWAVAQGLLNGSGGQLMPKAGATRAEVAAIIHRFMER